MFRLVRNLNSTTEHNYIVHKGDEKDPGQDQILVSSKIGRQGLLVESLDTQFVIQVLVFWHCQWNHPNLQYPVKIKFLHY